MWRLVAVALLLAIAAWWFVSGTSGEPVAHDSAREPAADSSGGADFDSVKPLLPPSQSATPNPARKAATIPPHAVAQGVADANLMVRDSQLVGPLDTSQQSAPRAAAGGDPRESRMPRDWRACYPSTNAANGGYLFSSDDSDAWSGSLSASVSSRVERPNPAGAGFCQTISAAGLKGKRVEYSIHMRTRDAMPGAHIVFRAENADGRVVAFYNMAERWVRGTADWMRYSVVIDVPENAVVIFVGATLIGTGTLWIDDAGLQAVSATSPLTQRPQPLNFYNLVVDPGSLPAELRNTGFEVTVNRPQSDY